MNLERFKIIAKKLPRSSHNIVLMLKTRTSIANVISYLVEIKQEVFANRVNPQSSFIGVFNSFDENGTVAISLCPSKSSLQMNYFPFIFHYSPYFSIDIPFVGEDHLC